MHACMYCMRIYVCACIYVYMHVCIYVCMCAYIYVYMYFSSWVLSGTGGGIVLVGRGNCPGGIVRGKCPGELSRGGNVRARHRCVEKKWCVAIINPLHWHALYPQNYSYFYNKTSF